MIGIELMEGGKDSNKKKKYEINYPAGTAVVLRLLERYYSSRRIVVVDSAFASVILAITLLFFGLY